MSDTHRTVEALAPEEVRAKLGLDGKGKGRKVLRWVLLVLAIAALSVGVSAWSRARRAPKIRFETVKVARADLKVTVSATGTLKTQRTIEVGAEVTGRVLEVRCEPNDPVKKGDLLAVIDPEQSRASLDESDARVSSAKASHATALATLKEARLSLDRAEKQRPEGLISEKELEAARAVAERARAQADAATAELSLVRAQRKNAQTKLDKTKIFSPIDGIVLARLVEPGQTVTAGFATPVLFKLAEDLGKMRLHVDVDEADVGRVREGQAASVAVDAFASEPLASKVLNLRYEPKVEQNVVSYEALLSIDNKDLRLRPGMTATATIVTDAKNGVLSIPNGALRFVPPAETLPRRPPGSPLPMEEDGPHVWILQDGKPKAMRLVPGSTDGERTEVSGEGVTEGLEVIVDTKEGP